MPQHPQNEFGWLLRDVRQAFRRRDCGKAAQITRKLILHAKTPAQRETVLRLQNAVRRCGVKFDVAPLRGFPKGYRKRKGQSVKTTRFIPGYPVGIPTGTFVDWQEMKKYGGATRHRVTHRGTDYWLDDDAFEPLGGTSRPRRRRK